MHAGPATPPPAGAARRRALPLAGWCLLLYFGAHALVRLLVSPALELDEAEQALWSQQLQWGYGAQPPLYTWLQWAVFRLAGVSLAGLALLKHLLLALAYAAVYLAGRTLLPRGPALLAAAGMLLLPQIGWEASRDLTHSVLLTALAAATLAVALALLRRPQAWLYLLAGLLVGLGLLSKYSYAVFLLVLLLALATGDDTRPVLLRRWALAGAALALLITLPHALWLLEHGHEAAARLAETLEGPPPRGEQTALLRGLGRLLLVVATFIAPFALAAALLFGRAARAQWRHTLAPHPRLRCDVRAFWRRYFCILAVVLLALVLSGAVGVVKERWLMPLLFLVPLAFFSSLPDLAAHAALPRMGRLLAGVALLILALMALRAPFHGWRGHPDELNAPVRALAQALRAQGYDGQGAIAARPRALAGGLRLQFPAARVLVIEDGQALPDIRPLLLVQALGADEASPQAAAQTVALPYLYAGAAVPPARYAWRLLP